MAREDWSVRPDWFPAWWPKDCPGCGRPVIPIQFGTTWQPCQCPGAKGGGHELLVCKWDSMKLEGPRCNWSAWPPPPEHVGPGPD